MSVDQVHDLVARLLVSCWFNSLTITFVTAVAAALMGGVLLLVRREILQKETWLRYLGYAFGAWFLQYGVRFAAALLRRREAHSVARGLENFAQSAFSNTNSLFLLLAALELLYRLPRRWWRTRWTSLLIPLFAISAALQLLGLSSWNRNVDAGLSAFCLLVLSFAMFANSGTRQRRNWAYLNVAGGVSYALLHFVYGLVPALARYRPIAQHLEVNISKLANKVPPLEDVLDMGVFALAFMLKISLFIGALLVVVRCLSTFSPTAGRDVMLAVKTARGEFLADDGIVRAMGESIGADAVVLCVRLPGSKADRVLLFSWTRDELPMGSVEHQRSIPRPLPEESTIGRTLVTGDILDSHDHRADPRFSLAGYWDFVPGMRSFVNVPLLYHGAAVGCLNFEWRNKNGYTATDVQRARQVADFVMPVVQTERWLRAIAALGKRLQHYNLDPERQAAGHFIGWLGEEVHDVLSPSGTLVVLDFGFKTEWVMCGPAHVSSDDPGESRTPREIEAHFRSLSGPGERIGETPITLNRAPIGKMLFAIRGGCDPVARPSLTMDHEQLQTIAALVRDVMFDLHGIRFGALIHMFHTALGAGTEMEWRRALQTVGMNACLKWVKVHPDKEIVQYGLKDAAAAFDIRAMLDTAPVEIAGRRVYRVLSAVEWESVVEIHLPQSGETVYAGVARSDFGLELDSGLPWSIFVTRLAEAADSALAFARAVELENDAMEFEMNHFLVHELRNPAEEFELGVEWMEKSIGMSPNAVAKDSRIRMLNNLKTSARQFLELANVVSKPVRGEGRSAVPVSELRERVLRFYGNRVTAQGIALEWVIPEDWTIKIPLRVAYLVVVTLVQNARDAVMEQGAIRISQEESAESLLVHVDDNGCGIPDDLREEIFKFGFTTKGGGTGRGLPLAARALHRYRGDVWLERCAPSGMSTRFTIVFPREIV